ncbi:MAG: hypothetical protein HOP95_10630 [Sphingomonas sp.]|nr:hypothetical protein [Sphingomonas sp.]
MRRFLVLLLPLALGGCIVGAVAKTAFDVATIPVKVASAGVNAVLPSQKKEDEKRGREARKQDEERGKQIRMAMERCRQGKPLTTDNCAALQPR